MRLPVPSPVVLLLLSAVCLPPGANASSAESPARHGRRAPLSHAAPAASGAEAAASAGGRATAAAAEDPIDGLRQRLAERLAAGKSGGVIGSGELRLVSRTTPPSPSIGAAVATAADAAPVRKARAAPPVAAEPHAHWAYAGTGGPSAWGTLKPEFALCANGQRQSPIDIRGGLAVDLDPVRFDYQPSRFGVLDNGHTLQVNVAPGSSIDVGGHRFELQQFHFHRPSEERIDGRQFEMSLHLVHKDEQGRLAVVAVLFDKADHGPLQPEVQKVWNNLPLERDQESTARAPIDLAGLLPTDRRYFTYMGSLTTPPCSEGVQWIVMQKPVVLTAEQIGLFARIYPMNARPVQSASGRRILQSQ